MKTHIYNIENVEYTIKIGQNSKENWNLIDNSEPDDLWIHLDDYPSAHVIISKKYNIQNVNVNYPNQIIMIASNYCKSCSKYCKNLHNVKIIYTLLKNIKKGKEIGSVIISNPNYVFV